MRELPDCVWPAVLDTARQPFRSRTWIARLSVILDRDGGDLARSRRLGPARFEHAVRRLILAQGGQKPCLRIVGTAVLDALELTGLVTSITGISAVGAAAILAQTGDPRRFATARALAPDGQPDADRDQPPLSSPGNLRRIWIGR